MSTYILKNGINRITTHPSITFDTTKSEEENVEEHAKILQVKLEDRLDNLKRKHREDYKISHIEASPNAFNYLRFLDISENLPFTQTYFIGNVPVRRNFEGFIPQNSSMVFLSKAGEENSDVLGCFELILTGSFVEILESWKTKKTRVLDTDTELIDPEEFKKFSNLVQQSKDIEKSTEGVPFTIKKGFITDWTPVSREKTYTEKHTEKQEFIKNYAGL